MVSEPRLVDWKFSDDLTRGMILVMHIEHKLRLAGQYKKAKMLRHALEGINPASALLNSLVSLGPQVMKIKTLKRGEAKSKGMWKFKYGGE